MQENQRDGGPGAVRPGKIKDAGLDDNRDPLRDVHPGHSAIDSLFEVRPSDKGGAAGISPTTATIPAATATAAIPATATTTTTAAATTAAPTLNNRQNQPNAEIFSATFSFSYILFLKMIMLIYSVTHSTALTPLVDHKGEKEDKLMTQQGQYQQPPPQHQQAPPYPQYPPPQYQYIPESDSIKSMLNIAGIVALIFGIIYLLIGIGLTVIILGFGIIIGIIPILLGVVDILIYTNCKTISHMGDRRQYQEAKSKTLVWMVIGFIFGGLIPGLLILLAYLKFDDLIRATQPVYYPPPQQYYPQQPPPQQQPPPPPPPQGQP